MGIKGLLKGTKSLGTEKHLRDYRGKRVVVDGYSWLHKAVYSCTRECSEE